MNIIKNAKNIVTAKLCETLELEINGQVYKVDKMIIDYFRFKEMEYAKKEGRNDKGGAETV